MKPRKATVFFKTKVRQMLDRDNVARDYIEYKRKVSRSDCDLKPHEHDYYNSDLFPSMLQRAYFNATQQREWQWLSALPACVTVDSSGFLATVTVEILV